MKTSPAFQFYPKDWLGSRRVSMLPLDAEGAYIRALCHCWNYGSIPANPQALAMLIGKQTSTTLAEMVAAMFEPSPDVEGELIHPRMDAEREKQRKWKEKSAKGGKNKANRKGGNSKEPRVVEECSANGIYQNPTLQSSSPEEDVQADSSGKRKSKAKAKTADEVEEFTLSAQLAPGEGLALFDKWEGNGWTNDGRPIKDWKSTIRNWIHRGYIQKRQDNFQQQPSRSDITPAKPIISLPEGMKAMLDGEELSNDDSPIL